MSKFKNKQTRDRLCPRLITDDFQLSDPSCFSLYATFNGVTRSVCERGVLAGRGTNDWANTCECSE
jgi:hypothetical protein